MNTRIWTRRQFALAAAAMPFALQTSARALSTKPRPTWVFLGTDKGHGIYRARWNAASGELGPIELAAASERPNFFVLHPHLPVLYTVNEADGPAGAISSFRFDAAKGTLTPLNKVDSHGAGPCALGIDRDGDALFVADYSGGAFAAYRLEANGAIGPLGGSLVCKGNPACGVPGPAKDRQDAAHLHCAVVAPGNDFVLVCDLGDDALQIFPLTDRHGRITGAPQRIAARPGSGPRHLVFDPHGKWFYCIHELDCTIDIYDWTVARGVAQATLRPDSTLSTLRPGTARNGNTGCEVHVTSDGRFLYACTRGVNEITVYAIDRTNDRTNDRSPGALTELQRVSSGGKIPRYFALDPSERWLACTNQGAADTAAGANVTVFERSPRTGLLRSTPKTFPAPTPMFLLWV